MLVVECQLFRANRAACKVAVGGDEGKRLGANASPEIFNGMPRIELEFC